MNLQPMNRSRHGVQPKDITVYCAKCAAGTRGDLVQCDLDAKPGTYYCPICVVHLMVEAGAEVVP